MLAVHFWISGTILAISAGIPIFQRILIKVRRALECRNNFTISPSILYELCCSSTLSGAIPIYLNLLSCSAAQPVLIQICTSRNVDTYTGQHFGQPLLQASSSLHWIPQSGWSNPAWSSQSAGDSTSRIHTIIIMFEYFRDLGSFLNNGSTVFTRPRSTSELANEYD